ncbi:MAG: hypothetical protein P1U56_12530, partial [Saprospiraceae bacterium]|nr:hypothetical protein [Saprospiraceae bacterium]
PIVKSQATLLFTSNLIPKLLVFYVSLLLNMPSYFARCEWHSFSGLAQKTNQTNQKNPRLYPDFKIPFS